MQLNQFIDVQYECPKVFQASMCESHLTQNLQETLALLDHQVVTGYCTTSQMVLDVCV